MLITVSLVLLLLLLLSYNLLHDLYLIYWRGIPPGPLSLPLIGGLHHLSLKAPNKALQKLVTKYGKIFSIRLGPAGRMVIVEDLDLIGQMCGMKEAADRPQLGFMGILSPGAEGLGSIKYGQKRKQLTRIFHNGIMKLSHDSFDQRVLFVFEQIRKRFSEHLNTPYNPMKDIQKTTYAVLGSLVYGVGDLDIDSEKLATLMASHTTIMSTVNPIHPINICPWLWHFPTPFKHKVQWSLEARDKLLSSSFVEHLSRVKAGAQKSSVDDLMDIIADFTTNNSDKMGDITHPDLLMTMWTMFLAGSDTVTDNCLWMCVFLAMNPEVQKRIQTEIDNNIPHNGTVSLAYKDNLPYTRATVLETLRMASVVFLGIPHCNLSTDITLGGHTIPKGTTMMQYVWSVHHDPDNWAEPDHFKPERFLDSTGKLLPATHIWREMPFIPFGRGTRTCIGKSIALDMIFLFLALMMKHFTFEFPAGFKPDLDGKIIFNLIPDDFKIITKARKTSCS